MNPILLMLWQASWQGGLVLLLIWVVCRWLRPSPSAQCWLWRLGQVKLLLCLLPLAVALPLLPRPPVVSAPSATIVSLTQMESVPSPYTGKLLPLERSQKDVPSPSFTARSASASFSAAAVFQIVIAGIWVLGVLLCLVRLAQGAARGRRLLRGATFLSDGDNTTLCQALAERLQIRRVPHLLLSDAVQSPLLIGVRAPTVLLPRLFWNDAPNVERQLVLAHELAHVARHDLWWQGFGLVTQVLFFFHPLVWLARREEQLTREIACDDLVLQLTGGDPARYGALLICIAAGNRRDVSPAHFSVGVVEKGEVLMKRLTLLGKGGAAVRRPLLFSVGTLALAGLLLVPWRLTAQTQTSKKAREARALPRRVDGRRTFGDRVIQGRVTDAQGRPIVGVRLRAHELDDDRSGWFGSSGGDATTNAAGEYTISGLAARPYLVRAEKAPEGMVVVSRSQINLQNGNVDGIDFVTAPAAFVKGRVQSRMTGRGLAGVRIVGSVANTDPREYTDIATTDQNGFYTVRVPAGQVLIRLGQDYGLSLNPDESPQALRKIVTVQAGENPRVEFPISATVDANLQGRLLDQSGSPVGDAQFFIGANHVASWQRSKTDGTFDFPIMGGAPQGVAKPIKIVVRQGNRSASGYVTPGENVSLHLRFKNIPVARVRGRVLGADGIPLANTYVSLLRQVGRFESGSEDSRTDARGYYEFEAAPEFKYRLFSQKHGYGSVNPPYPPLPPLSFRPGSTRELPPLILPLANGWAGGRVVDKEGQLIADAPLTFNGRHGSIESRTNRNGRFKVVGIVPGDKVYVNVRKKGLSGEVPIVAGRADNVVKVPPSR